MRLPFMQLDVFAPQPFSGNPLAVLFDAAGALPPPRMQAIAAWLGLSETVFLQRPQGGGDYRARIFTPGSELPFAGHPTLGSCAAWLHAGGTPRADGAIVQECGVGLVPVRPLTDAGGGEGAGDDAVPRLAFAAPPLRVEPVDADILAAVLDALGLSPAALRQAAWLDNGPRWLGLWLDTAARVLQLRPDMGALQRLDVKVGVAAPQPADADTAIEVRAFAPGLGVPEDPVTGSLNASLAQWLLAREQLPRAGYVAAQGTCLGRRGRVHVSTDAHGAVWIGGEVRVLLRGEIDV